MKYQPYREILDIRSELKEYKKLCRGKSKTFTYYSDWKSHIIKLISKTDSPKSINDFKHYLKNCKGVNHSVNSAYVPLIIFCMTIIFSQSVFDSNLFVVALCVLMVALMSAKDYEDYNKEYFFYKDLIKIIDEIVMEKGET